MHQRVNSHSSAAEGSDTSSSSASSSPDDVKVKESWNKPRGNIFRTLASFYAFVVMGMHGPAFGALIPYIASYYNLSYTILSLIFLPNLCGYVTAAATTGIIHRRLGRRGIAIIAPLSQTLACLVICTHPPFPIVVISLIFVGWGVGLQDSAWNAYVGDLAHATETLGLLQGVFGLGAIVGPLIATVMITKGHLEWYTYYYVMFSGSCLTLLTAVPAFWTSTGARYRSTNPTSTPNPPTSTPTSNDTTPPPTPTLTDILFRNPRTSLIIRLNTLFIICYVGAETAIAGWIVTYMLTVRHAAPLAAGLVVSGFWLGLCLGRVVLGFVTPRLGARRAVSSYAATALLLEILFALVPRLGGGVRVSAALVAAQGFFLGPMFPSGILVLTTELPREMHVQGLALMCSCGAVGATVFPFIVGALAEARGVGVMVPVMLVVLACMLGAWVAVSAVTARGAKEEEDAEDEREPLLGGEGRPRSRSRG